MLLKQERRERTPMLDFRRFVLELNAIIDVIYISAKQNHIKQVLRKLTKLHVDICSSACVTV